MKKQVLNWVRSWDPLSSNVASAVDGAVTTDALPRKTCLVLLGPPGAGKTTELQRLEVSAKARGEYTRTVNLRYIPSAEDLKSELNDVVEAVCSASDISLAVFLDGLDEIPARIDHACRWVIAWLKQARDRKPDENWLSLYITCRVADWPANFETELAALCGETNVSVYQLAKLTVRDVEIAFKPQDPARWIQFSSALEKGNLWPLAYQPVTLQMLVRTFLTGNNTLPRSLVALYRTALLAMVEDWRNGNAAVDGDPTAPEQLVLAGRIAAASILSNKPNIWVGVYSEQAPASALPISELVGGTEQFLEHSFPADERALRRVLHTAVFRGGGEQLFTWEHLTFAEYLTALYLLSRNLPDERLLEFLGTVDNGVLRITPQLREVAGWLAGMSATFRKTLIASEPELLLRSDIAGADHEFKEALTRELLSRLDRRDLHDWWRDSRLDYGRLECPGLPEVLRPYLAGPNHIEMARRAAINIARACSVKALAPVLLEFALSEIASSDLRALAIWTYSTLSEEGIERLQQLLTITPVSDPDDEIKGAVLQALWPRHLDAIRLFKALTPPQNQNRYGTYKLFLHELIIHELSPDASVAALDWLSRLTPDTIQGIELRKLAQPVLRAAWRHVRQAHVMSAFAEMVACSIRGNNLALQSVDISDFEKQYLAAPTDLRRAFVMEAVHLLDAPKRYDLRMGPWRLVRFEDLPWLLEDLIAEHPRLPEDMAIESIVTLTFGHELEELAFIWPVMEKHQRLQEAWQVNYTVLLDSPFANWQREEHEKKTRPQPESTPQGPDPLRQEGLDRWIQDCKNDGSKWWILNLLLLNDGAEGGLHELSAGLVVSPGWLGATEAQQGAMLDIAARYLEHERPPAGVDWLGSGTVWRPVSAAYRSLRLLYTEQHSAFAALSTTVWESWGATSLWFPSNEDSDDKKIRFAVARVFYEKAPQAFLTAFRKLLALPDSGFELAELAADIYDEAIASELWAALERGHLNRFTAERIAELLLDKGYPPIKAAAVQWLVQPRYVELQSNGDSQPTMVFIPGLYFVHAAGEAWPLLWGRRELDSDHATAIWMWVARHSVMDAPYLASMEPKQLGQLFTWLTDEFPRPEPRSSGFFGPLDHLDQVRSLTIDRLTAIGSTEAVDTLKDLVDQYRDLDFLRVQLKAAQDAARASAWIWPSLQEIFSRLGIVSTRNVAEAVLAQSEIDHKPQSAPESSGLSSLEDMKFNLAIPLEQVRRRLIFLLVATEWKSSKGGLSTFNREFSNALANAGQTVYCLVPSADAADIDDANKRQVTLLSATPQLGFEGVDLLTGVASAPLPDNVKPHVIVGHDHITGRQAFRIRNLFYPEAKAVHILHTTSEIESLKGRRTHVQAALRGGEREEDQRLLCTYADLVMAVGPRIFEYARGVNADQANVAVKIVEFIPGFDEEYLVTPIDDSTRRQKLILWIGRGDEPNLKGLSVALEVIKALDARPLVGTNRARLFARGLNIGNSESEGVKLCNEYIEKWVKPNAIRMLDFTEDRRSIRRDLMSATCLIMPSLIEPYGLIAQEAIALGVPVFVSIESGIANLLLSMKARTNGQVVISESMLLEVSADIGETAKKWAATVEECLNNEQDAFDQAKKLRSELAPYMNWNRSIADFIGHITPLLGGILSPQ